MKKVIIGLMMVFFMIPCISEAITFTYKFDDSIKSTLHNFVWGDSDVYCTKHGNLGKIKSQIFNMKYSYSKQEFDALVLLGCPKDNKCNGDYATDIFGNNKITRKSITEKAKEQYVINEKNWCIHKSYKCLDCNNAFVPGSSYCAYCAYNFDEKSGTIMKYKGNSQRVVIPQKINDVVVRKIADEAFSNNMNIKTLVIQDNIALIGKRAFAYCYNLERVEIYRGEWTHWKEGITSNTLTIDEHAFLDCIRLSEVLVGGNASVKLNSFEGTRYDNEHNFEIDSSGVITKYKVRENEKGQHNVTIPDSVYGIKVIGIGKNVFSGRRDITGVIFPNTLVKIDDGAFYNCPNLKSSRVNEDGTTLRLEPGQLRLPRSVTSIGENAFAACPQITSVVSTIEAVPQNRVEFIFGDGAYFLISFMYY